MKILWLGNVMISQIAKHLNLNNSVFGGWLSGAIQPILNQKENTINYVFPYDNSLHGEIDNLQYNSFSSKLATNFEEELIKYFEDVVKGYQPDIIHIWGTEYTHSLCMVQACKNLNMIDKVVVNIQGLVSKCAEAYTIGLPKKIQKLKTIRDIIKLDNIYRQQKEFYRRGEKEKQLLNLVKNVCGRTEWDKKSCLEINPTLKYYFCNENLRDDFYSASKWELNSCEKHSIFCSQGSYPIKGFHFVVNALKILSPKYPDIKIYITGNDFVNLGWLQRQKLPYYLNYLRKLIIKNNLSKKIVFLGRLNAEQMIERYQKSHLFLSPSTMENSSNSIGEAMLIGTPVVSSNVGGCSTMIDDKQNGLLYELKNEKEMIDCIEMIFNNDDLANRLSHSAIIKSSLRHDVDVNYTQMMKIYQNIINSKE